MSCCWWIKTTKHNGYTLTFFIITKNFCLLSFWLLFLWFCCCLSCCNLLICLGSLLRDISLSSSLSLIIKLQFSLFCLCNKFSLRVIPTPMAVTLKTQTSCLDRRLRLFCFVQKIEKLFHIYLNILLFITRDHLTFLNYLPIFQIRI